jgi:tetratricopeptide (TPR) repeat protein
MKRINLIAIAVTLFVLAGCGHVSKTLRPAQAPKKHSVSFKARDHFLQGLYYQQEGRYNEALVEYYQALHFDSTSATIYRTIGENYMNLGHYESAEIMLKKAHSLAPNDIRTLNLLAECELRSGNGDKAIEYYEQLLKIDPYDNDARQMLILLYEKEGRDMDVARQNQILMRLYGKNKEGLFKLVQIYLKHDKLNLAQKNCRAILQLDSTDARSYFILGLIKEQQSQTDSAAYFYQKALHFNPTLRQALDRLAFLWESQKKWAELISVLKRTIRVDSTYLPAKIILAESYFYAGKLDSARAVLLPLTKRPDIPLGVFELLGRIELQDKHPGKAREYFLKILAQDSTNKMALIFLGFSYSDLDSTAQAEQVYRKAPQFYPDDPMLWAFYGNVLQSQKKYAQAIDAFNKTLKLQPDNENALSGLGIIYDTLKDYAKCDSIYEIAIKRLPDNALILNNYSYSLTERNLHLKKALKLAQKAIELEPNNAAYLDTYGWVLYKLGKYRQAAEYIKKSIELRENSAVVIEHLGDVYRAMGNLKEAVEQYQKALDLNPGNQSLKQKIEEISNE